MPQDNPLHISLFPPHMKSKLDFTFMLNSCLDIFDIRQHNKTIDQDLGLLQAIDERLAMYGWLTTTGVKFVIIIDMAGRPAPRDGEMEKGAPVVGLRDSDLKPVSLLPPSYNTGQWPPHDCVGLTLSISLTKFPLLGFPRPPDGVHTSSTKSILYSRRPYANGNGSQTRA
ncbi:hypothetical protein MMC16_000747 [Acarospora aff. strigata]|nr:hypothetical protein [Acarospora aff. strigata]